MRKSERSHTHMEKGNNNIGPWPNKIYIKVVLDQEKYLKPNRGFKNVMENTIEQDFDSQLRKINAFSELESTMPLSELYLQ